MLSLSLLLPEAGAQTQPDLRAVLKRVSEIYKAATEYEFIEDVTCRGGPNTAQSAHVMIALRLPDKWAYFPQENLYDSLPIGVLDPDAGGDLSHLGPDAVDHETMSAYREAAEAVGVVFTTIKLNEPLPDELFKFTPPPGVKKITPETPDIR